MTHIFQRGRVGIPPTRDNQSNKIAPRGTVVRTVPDAAPHVRLRADGDVQKDWKSVDDVVGTSVKRPVAAGYDSHSHGGYVQPIGKP